MKQVFIALFFCALAGYSASAQKQKLYKAACGTFTSENLKPTSEMDTSGTRSMVNQYLVWDVADGPITVKFMPGGSKALRTMITNYAKEWEKWGNVKLQFLPDDAAMTNIRIKLGEGLGHNSGLGLDNNNIPQSEQTMNLDTMDFLNYDYYIAELKRTGKAVNMDEFKKLLASKPPVWNQTGMRGTTLHEFGHALGLMHEQSYPGAIKWNKDTVYKYYEKTQGWNKSKVDYQVFRTAEQFFTNGTAYDKLSIMHYPVERWQTSDGYSLPANNDLSAGDKAIIAAMYPANLSTATVLPRVMVTNVKLLDVVNDPVKGGLRIYPAFDLRTNAALGTVYVVARPVDENNFYIRDDNDLYSWGGNVAVYPKLTLLPNSRTSYNKDKRNLELFLPYSELPVPTGKKVKFQISVALWDQPNNQLVYVSSVLPDKMYSVTK